MECYRRYNKKGFTLMECLIIIAVILILTGISVPVFKQLQPSFQLSGAARDLITNLRYAQQLTITEQVNYCVKLFSSERKYQIIQCGESNPLSEVFLPSEIATLDASGFTESKVEFNPYGAVREQGTIVLENTQNKTKTIEVKPSGFIRIAD